jgi:Ala-tRNA(Pro) deacylase
MALLACLADVLKRERVPYLTLRHPPAFTAPELSAIAHIPGRRSAKVVICIADGRPLQAVVPAHHAVDLEALRELAKAVSLRLAREEEIAALYPEFEVGAMPPFGRMHGHPVFVERCFVGEPEMVFNAGTHTDSLCMHYGDFAEIAKPTVGVFGVPPARSPRRSSRHVRPSRSPNRPSSIVNLKGTVSPPLARPS